MILSKSVNDLKINLETDIEKYSITNKNINQIIDIIKDKEIENNDIKLFIIVFFSSRKNKLYEKEKFLIDILEDILDNKLYKELNLLQKLDKNIDLYEEINKAINAKIDIIKFGKKSFNLNIKNSLKYINSLNNIKNNKLEEEEEEISEVEKEPQDNNTNKNKIISYKERSGKKSIKEHYNSGGIKSSIIPEDLATKKNFSQ